MLTLLDLQNGIPVRKPQSLGGSLVLISGVFLAYALPKLYMIDNYSLILLLRK